MAGGGACPDPRSPEEPDDSFLVARAQRGDLLAFERLLRRHERRMYRLAYRLLGDRGRAEDAVQESFVSVWRRIDKLRADAAFTSWLYRIVTNRCLSTARTVRPTVDLDQAAARGTPSTVVSTGPEQEAVRRGQLAALRFAVEHLPPDLRACWVLREQDGLGYEEIGEIVGASPVAVRGRIHRARKTLAEAMRPWR